MAGQSKLRPQQQQQQPNCPPPSKLPELCLLAIFSQMDLVDRFSALAVCPRWHYRVREINAQTVRSLTITVAYKNFDEPLSHFQHVVNFYLVSGNKSVQLLTKVVDKVTGKEEQEFLIRLTKFNCLNFKDGELKSLERIRQIVSFYGGIIELTFVVYSKFDELKNLIKLLEEENGFWQKRLQKLYIVNWDHSERPFWQEMFKIINSMSSLQRLSIVGIDELPNKTVGFSVLNQLTELKFVFNGSEKRFNLSTFLSALEQVVKIPKSQQRPENLKVELAQCIVHYGATDANLNIIPQLSELSLAARQTITRLNYYPLTTTDVPNFHHFTCSFPSLTSLNFKVSASQCVVFFAALAQLKNLFYLSLHVEFTKENQNSDFSSLRLHPLLSLRALNLFELKLHWHEQIRWLDLPRLMPRLEAFYLVRFFCRGCGTSNVMSSFNGRKYQDCLLPVMKALCSDIHIQLKKIFYYINNEIVSAEGLMTTMPE